MQVDSITASTIANIKFESAKEQASQLAEIEEEKRLKAIREEQAKAAKLEQEKKEKEEKEKQLKAEKEKKAKEKGFSTKTACGIKCGIIRS